MKFGLGKYEIEITFSKRLKFLKKALPYLVLAIILLGVNFLMPYNLRKKSSKLFAPEIAKANYQYTATAGQINNSDGTQRYNSFNQTRAADTSTWTVSPIDITPPDVSLDTEVTIGGVQLQGANKLITTFRVSTSNVTLHYVFSIWDNTDSIWRPLNNHTAFNPASPGDLTNFYSRELVPAAVSTFYTYQFEIFNGYFVDTTTTPGAAIATPLDTHFISSNNVKLRVSSNDDPGTATWFMNWDFAQLEVAIDPGYAPSAVAKTTGTWGSRYYSDVFTSDNAETGTTNTNSLNVVSVGNAVNFEFTFDDIESPYTGANTILLWYEGATSVANLSGNLKIYFWNYSTSGWEAVAVSSGNASSTTASQNRIMMFSTPLANHISSTGPPREAKIKIEASHSASFTAYVDWIKLIIGSINDGTQQNNVSVGTPSGNLSDAGNVDTTAASPAVWTLTSSNTYTNQFYGDTNSTYSVAADFSMPITEPSSANITGVHLASRTNNSSATPVTPVGIKDYANAWSDFQTRAAGTAYVQHPYVVSGTTNPIYRYPVWGAFGSASAATTALNTIFGQNPQDYHDSTNNLFGFKIRTSTGLASSFTVALDFAFLSIRYVSAESQMRTQFTPDTAVKNTGGAETNTWRYTKAADSQYWTIANSGAGVGVDVDLEFQGVTAPTTWNKLIVNTKYAWSVASVTHNMQIYDYASGVWRVLGGHGQVVTDYQLVASGTASTQQYYQFEVFNGYFRNTDATPGTAISTPVTNFIGTGADLGKVKIKIIRGATTGNLILDWAQIELAQDNVYYPRSASFNGIGTSQQRFYNDTFYPDNTVNTASSNFTYSLGVTKATSGTDRLNLQLNFENIVTPYSGANAIFLDTQVSSTSANTVVSIQIYNFTNGNWNDTLNTGTVVPTASRYFRYQFIRPVSNWADYINPSSPNDIRIRFYTTNTTAATFYVDFARIMLGSVTSAGENGGVTWGTNLLNDKTTTATLNTTAVPSLTANTLNAWFINSSGTGRRTTDGISGVSANIDFSVDVPSGALVTGIKWANVFNTNSSWTMQVQFRDNFGDYTYANPNAQYLLWSGGTTANPGLAPTAGDANSLASATQTMLSGLNQLNPEDKINTQTDKINMALRTSTSTLLVEQSLIWDAAFVTIRYVIP